MALKLWRMGDSKPPRSQRARETERAYEHMAKSFVVIEIEQSTSCTAKRGWMGKNKSCHWGSEHKINVQQSWERESGLKGWLLVLSGPASSSFTNWLPLQDAGPHSECATTSSSTSKCGTCVENVFNTAKWRRHHSGIVYIHIYIYTYHFWKEQDLELEPKSATIRRSSVSSVCNRAWLRRASWMTLMRLSGNLNATHDRHLPTSMVHTVYMVYMQIVSPTIYKRQPLV